jgi:hypothetical protein
MAKFIFSDIGPHPACLDGEQVGQANLARLSQGPIRLVRMVNQFHRCSGENYFTIQASWMGSPETVSVFAS